MGDSGGCGPVEEDRNVNGWNSSQEIQRSEHKVSFTNEEFILPYIIQSGPGMRQGVCLPGDSWRGVMAIRMISLQLSCHVVLGSHEMCTCGTPRSFMQHQCPSSRRCIQRNGWLSFEILSPRKQRRRPRYDLRTYRNSSFRRPIFCASVPLCHVAMVAAMVTTGG